MTPFPALFLIGPAHAMTTLDAHGKTVIPDSGRAKFLNTLDTGDILLFDTKGRNAKLIHTAQGIHYDHVGLVIKDVYTKKLRILEAVVPEVMLFDLHDRVNNATANQIVARTLTGVVKDDAFRNTLQVVLPLVSTNPPFPSLTPSAAGWQI